jgi:hypothetical protein
VQVRLVRGAGVHDVTLWGQMILARNEAIEAAIHRFRECGVEIERFRIVEVRSTGETHLCIDGTSRLCWTMPR